MKSPLAAPAYTRTKNVDLAAAFSVLGIEIKMDYSVDRISGNSWKSLLIGLDSVDYQAIGAKPDDETPLPSHKTELILSMLRKGMLQQSDPTHPVLDVLRVCKAEAALQTWIRTGQEHQLVKVEGCDRYQLVPANLPPSVKTGPCLFGTRDLKMASALCALGFPVARLEDAAPRTLICFTGPRLGTPPALASDLAQAIRTKRLQEETPEHPMLWMIQGLINRDAIRDMMNQRKPLVLLRAPGTGRASLVSSNAKARTMDRVQKHLRIA